VPALLEALAEPADRALEHSLTYALLETADVKGTMAGLQSASPLVRRAVLAALDQMEGGGLQPETVTRAFASTDARLKETAWWIAGRHADWAPAVTGFLRERLAVADKLTPAERDELVRHLTRFVGGASIRKLLAERLADTSSGAETRRVVLRVMARANLKETPPDWIAGLTGVLNGDKADFQMEAVAAVRGLRLTPKQAVSVTPVLVKIGGDAGAVANLRVAALAAVPRGLAKVEPSLFDFLRSRLEAEQPVAVRGGAAEVLAKAKLDEGQLLLLADTLKSVGPLEVERLLDAFASSTEDKVGLALVSALQASPVRSSLRVETLKPRLAKFGPTVQHQAEALYAALDGDASKQRARLEQLLASLKDGDVRRGQAVFNSSKAACASCHAIGYLGGNVGPDLTHIGKIRNERDLLESIVFPSASLVRSYEPVQVTTKSGKVYNGLVRQDAAEEMVLATGPNQEARLARDDIEEVQPSKVSVMPAGLDGQLTARELADLVAFLRACK
jgi:putative heme-binding domain-containing protein